MPEFAPLDRGEVTPRNRDVVFDRDLIKLCTLFEQLNLDQEGISRSWVSRIWKPPAVGYRFFYVPLLKTGPRERHRTRTTRWSRVACKHAYRALYRELRKQGLRPDEIKLLDGVSEDAQHKVYVDVVARECSCPFDWTVKPAEDLNDFVSQLAAGAVRARPFWIADFRSVDVERRLRDLCAARGQGSEAAATPDIFLGYRYFEIQGWPTVGLHGPYSGAPGWEGGVQYAICTRGGAQASHPSTPDFKPTAQELLLYGEVVLEQAGAETRTRARAEAEAGVEAEVETERPLLFTSNKLWRQHLLCVSHLNAQVCACGFYSFRDPLEVQRQYGSNMRWDGVASDTYMKELPAWVLGQVVLGGSVLQGDDIMGSRQGFRSSQARIEGIWICSPEHQRMGWDVRPEDEAFLEQLRYKYRCHIELFIRQAQWVEFRDRNSLRVT